MLTFSNRIAYVGAVLLLMGGTGAAWAADEPVDRLDVTLGGGVAYAPKYTGAKDSEVKFVPLLKATYGRFFIGGEDTGLGVGYNLVQNQAWLVAIAVTEDLSPRSESSDPHLAGLGPVKSTPRAVLLTSYGQDWFKVGGLISQDIGGNHEGLKALAFARAQYNVNERTRLFAGPRVTWGNGDYMQAMFGVNATQSANSGLAQYQAGSGITGVGFDTGVDFRFDKHWGVGARLNYNRLEGDAADSPITEKANQLQVGGFLMYHF